MKNKKPSQFTLITVKSNTKEAVRINAELQAGRSGPEQQA